MSDRESIFDESFLPVQLKKQNFKLAIAISLALIMVIVVAAIATYWVNDPIGSSFIFTLSLLVCFPLILAQMLFFHKYLGNFQNGERAQYFMKFLIAATSILFVLLFVSAFIGLVAEVYTVVICLIPQFLVGWQLVKINTKGNDFVGGLSWLGPVLCTSAILVPLIFVIPILVGYVFFRANKYADLYGYSNN